MKKLYASLGCVLKIGYEGEDSVTQIVFPYDESWLSCGSGTFYIRVLRPTDDMAYNATEVTDDRESMRLIMTVTDIELSVEGQGEMQVVYICSDAIKKSPVYHYHVRRAIDAEGTVDPPEGSIIGDLIRSVAEIKDNVGDLDDLTTTDKSDLVSAINEVNDIDTQMSDTSERPVQNRVIKSYVDDAVSHVTIDVDDQMSEISENPVQNKVVTKHVSDIAVAMVGSAIEYTDAVVQPKADKTYVDTTVQNAKLKNIQDGAGTGAVEEGCLSGNTVVSATGQYAHAEGMSTKAQGARSHAEGGGTTASGSESHAEGAGTKATADSAHAEGGGCTASGNYAHAEGSGTTASGQSSHAEGISTKATAQGSHAEGNITEANGHFSHAGGLATKADGFAQTVIGEYNLASGTADRRTGADDELFIIGNGEASARSNAHSVSKGGVGWYRTDVKVGGTAHTNALISLVDMNTELAGKADKSYVDAEIDSVQEDLNSKAPAVLESVSGSVVSFEDGAELPAESVIAHIEPQQDLHGYDNPWPAGGGKNLLDPSTASAFGNTVWFCEPSGFLFKGGVSYTFSVSNSDDVSSIAIYSTDKSTQLAYSTSSTRQSVTYTPTEDTYGLPRLYRTTAITQDIVNGTMIEIGSARTTFAPYSNICPITGWTGATVQRTGKNLFDVRKSTAFNNKVTLTFNADGSMTCKNDNSYPVVPTSSIVISVPNGIYTVSSSSAITSNTDISFYASDDGVNYSWYANGLSSTVLSRTVTINKPYVRLRWQVEGNTTDTLPPIQLELGSTATAYELYQGETYDITFPTEAGTVYGGTLDVTKGVLTVDRAVLDMGTITWRYIDTATYPYFRSVGEVIQIKPSVGNTIIHPLICSMYKTETWSHTVDSNDYDASICLGWTGKSYVAVRDSRYTTLEEFTTAMNGVELCYELATPVTYNITPQEIMTLLGTNTIWSDTGNIDVEYRADTKAYVDNLGVSDVQINGTSIVSDGVAEIPIAKINTLGVVKTQQNYGILTNNDGGIYVDSANSLVVKNGTDTLRPIAPSKQHESTFYGLAKVAGHDEKNSTLPVGQYTEEAKSAISDMLNGAVQVSGTTPTITALSGVRYVCGEVSTLDITPCASGICDIVFTSGSTATVLTLPSTVKFPDGAFTPEANTTYEINILDGVYGAVMAWT